MANEIQILNLELKILRTEFKNLVEDMRELQTTQKELLHWMYKVRGGQTWLFGLLATAGVMGGLFSNIASYFFRQ